MKISIKGVEIAYSSSAVEHDQTKQTIILLHGWGCTQHTMGSMAQFLSHDFNVYALDFPGFGESGEPLQIWGVEEYTSMLEEFVERLKIENPILIGHSFGGRVSLLYASRNSVKKVIIVDGAGIKPSRSLKYYLKVYSYKTYKCVLPYIIGKKQAESKLDMYRKRAGSTDYRNTSGIMRAVFVKVVNEDLKYVMPLIKAPVLLIWGENDTATPVKDGIKMSKLIPNAGLVVFKGAGHYSFLDKPFDFKVVVNNFLAEDKQNR